VSFDLPQDPDGPGNGAPVSLPRQPRGRALIGTLLIIGFLLVAFWVFAGFYTDLLWFRSIGFTSVFTTELWTRLILFGFFGLIMGAVVAASFVIAYRTRPAFRGLSAEQQGLDRYRVAIDPFRRSLTVVICTVLGLLAGGSAAAEWQTFLQFRNSKPFFVKDAQFGVDVSFFAFRLPFWRFLVGFGFAVVVLSLIAALVSHYLYGGLRLQTPGEKTTPAARMHIAVLLGFFVMLKAISYWLDRYELVVKGNTADRISGATYTDVNALLPAKQILFWIAIICGLLFFATVVTRNWLAPGIGFGLLLLSAIVLGGIYPAFVQSVQVNPSEADKEAPYITRNIDATRDAYKLGDVEVKSYDPVIQPKPGQLEGDKSTVSNIRLIDPAVVSPTFRALQQSRQFYSFADTLDVDRYTLPGTTTSRDTVVAVRELDFSGLAAGQRNFTNDHTVFTHGYGLVAAYGNTSVGDGRPSFFASDIPPVGPLVITQPRVYFGEKSPDYSIVGSPKGKDPVEFDFPSDSQTGQSNTTYDGKGGVAMGSLFGRALFAAKFGDSNLLLSDRINSDSKILWDRQPRDRVQAVAPWLTVDGDSYPAVVDGRIVWILDGYTTTNGYPYSKRTTLGDVTADSLTTSSSSLIAQPRDEVNYIRNSVKAVVDAYDGTVTLYEWDGADPVLKVWEAAFPGTVKSADQISPELRAHLRYPQDLFKVQRDLYSKYHVTDPKAFYGRQDFWAIPDDPTKRATAEPQPPYYLTLQMPTQPQASFSLTTTFAPQGRDTLAAFMAVDSDATSSDYGKLRVLQLPRTTTVAGPGQVQNKFESDPGVSSELSLLRRGGSDVELGNLLSLPVGGGLLYVEPVYVRASTGSSYPLLKKVLVQFGTGLGFADTLGEALDQAFSGSSGGSGPTTSPPTGTTGGGNAALTKAITDAQQALRDSDAALKAGDFTAYGAAQARLKAAIAAAAAATAASASPSPSASASATTQ